MTLPIPASALEDCGAILGRRGKGKSNTMTVLWEHELDAGHRTVMIDPKGDRYGIRLAPDGSPSRFDVPIFGGPHADFPLADDMGATIAKLIATHDFSCLIDLSELSLAEQHRFMTPFAETLLKNNRAPITMFVEEADQFANQDQRYQPPKLLHHMMNLIMLGRQRGIIMWMATQRPAKLSKNLLSQVDAFVGMGVSSPNDREAYKDWFKGHSVEAAKKIEETIGSLKPGEAWVWLGNDEYFERVMFPMASTFDSGRRPKHGEAVADVKLERLERGAISDALKDLGLISSSEHADGKVTPGNTLMQEISAIGELQAELASLNSLFEEAQALYIESRAEIDRLHSVIGGYQKAFEAQATLIGDIQWPTVERRDGTMPGEALVIPPIVELREAPVSTKKPELKTRPLEVGSIGAERRILSVLSTMHPKGMTEARWSIAAGMKRSGGTWKTYKSRLKQGGHIAQLGTGEWVVSATGMSVVGEVPKFPPAGPELVREWARRIGGVVSMAEALIGTWPQWCTRENLAAGLNMASSGGTFKTYLSRLKSADIIETSSEGVRLSRDVMGVK